MQLNNVSLVKGDRIILHDITFTVPQQAIVVLTGESGAGKTTFLRLLSHLEKPTSGTLSGDGRLVGMVFQHLHLFPHLTIAQQIAHPLEIVHKMSKHQAYERAEEVLAEVGLLLLKDRFAHELSGGQQQRAAIARALASRPDVLLLDEPTSGLDRVTRDSLGALLRQLKERHGVTILMSTHDREFAHQLYDVWCVVEHGSLTCSFRSA